nr:hypothetical protein Itr_chr06CG15600 [Ipomoea trifida]
MMPLPRRTKGGRHGRSRRRRAWLHREEERELPQLETASPPPPYAATDSAKLLRRRKNHRHRLRPNANVVAPPSITSVTTHCREAAAGSLHNAATTPHYGEKNQSPLDRCGEAAGRKKRHCSPLGGIRRTTAAVVARVLAKLDETEVTGSKGENPRCQALLLRLSRGVPLPPPIIMTHAPPPAHEKGREAIPLTPKNQSPLDRCGEAAGRKKRHCSPLGGIRRTTAAVVARVLAKLDETEVTGSKGENPRCQALLLRLSRGVPLPPPIIMTHAPPPAHEKGREAIPLTPVATPY